MEKHKQPDKPLEIPKPDKHEEVILPTDPEDPIAIPEESPDIIPDNEPFETPPYEMPPYREGPCRVTAGAEFRYNRRLNNQ